MNDRIRRLTSSGVYPYDLPLPEVAKLAAGGVALELAGKMLQFHKVCWVKTDKIRTITELSVIVPTKEQVADTLRHFLFSCTKDLPPYLGCPPHGVL